MSEEEKKVLEAKLQEAEKLGLPAKVFLYVPNLVGYLRIISLVVAFAGYQYSYIIFMAGYIFSYILDQVDGMAARHFNQCSTVQASLGSKYGAMLDMLIDRSATVSLLIMLSRLYPTWFGYFLAMALIDIVSHWYQMYS